MIKRGEGSDAANKLPKEKMGQLPRVPKTHRLTCRVFEMCNRILSSIPLDSEKKGKKKIIKMKFLIIFFLRTSSRIGMKMECTVLATICLQVTTQCLDFPQNRMLLLTYFFLSELAKPT